MLVAVVALLSLTDAYEDNCSPFHEIYADGEDLCNRMFGEAFQMVESDENGYTMWFFDESNPNDAVTDAIWGAGKADDIDECHLNYYHKEVPSPEGDDFSECHPWKQNSCCQQENVPSAEHLRTMYGPGYEWDRCGPMTPACSRFFVQEACFYECEPNAGLWRKYNDSHVDHTDYNEWEISGMPIKRSYCDAWFTACRNDYFCTTGNFFSCEAQYWANLAANTTENITIIEENITIIESDDDDYPWVIIVVLSIVGVLFVCTMIFMISREKQGNPMFSPLVHENLTQRSPGNTEMGTTAE